MRCCVPILSAIALLAAAGSGGAQVMSVSTSSVDLPAPDTVAYDGGISSVGSFTVLVTTCAGASGCRVSIENPSAASPVPIDLQWRLMQVSQLGTGSLGCRALVPLLAWQALPAASQDLMDTAPVTDPGTACVAAIEVRAANVSYSAHQYTTPATTYWREVRFRTVER